MPTGRIGGGGIELSSWLVALLAVAEPPPFGMIWTWGEGDGVGGPPPRFMLDTGGSGWNSMFIFERRA